MPLGHRPGGCTSKLAVAALICSIANFVILPFIGSVAAIICGHLAKGRMNREPTLGGRGLATAGLIVGYLGLTVTLAIMALVAFAIASSSNFQNRQMANRSSRGAPARVEPVAPKSVEPVDLTPDGTGWTLDLQDVTFPDEAVSGRIHGQTFAMEKVSLEGGFLKFCQGGGFFADLEMDVVIFESNLAKLSGRTLEVPTEEPGSKPHIWMKWMEASGQSPQSKSYMDDYALRLEFGQVAGGKLPGKIYLCLPDPEKSFIRGTFEVNTRPGGGGAR